MESLLDFEKPLDINLLDNAVASFFKGEMEVSECELCRRLALVFIRKTIVCVLLPYALWCAIPRPRNRSKHRHSQEDVVWYFCYRALECVFEIVWNGHAHLVPSVFDWFLSFREWWVIESVSWRGCSLCSSINCIHRWLAHGRCLPRVSANILTHLCINCFFFFLYTVPASLGSVPEPSAGMCYWSVDWIGLSNIYWWGGCIDILPL